MIQIYDPSVQFQREIIKLISPQLWESGFVLAGSGAVREHGLIDRKTQDIDMFTSLNMQRFFTPAVNDTKKLLESNGYAARWLKIPDNNFAQLHVSRDGQETDIDFAIDYRANQPNRLAVGYVLSLEDAAANKVAALGSRGENRDFLDAVDIRRSGIFTTKELLDLVASHDAGITPEILAEALETMAARSASNYSEYVTKAEFASYRADALEWVGEIRGIINH
jgi:hypothetical protein